MMVIKIMMMPLRTSMIMMMMMKMMRRRKMDDYGVYNCPVSTMPQHHHNHNNHCLHQMNDGNTPIDR